jgi:hypothetical protein
MACGYAGRHGSDWVVDRAVATLRARGFDLPRDLVVTNGDNLYSPAAFDGVATISLPAPKSGDATVGTVLYNDFSTCTVCDRPYKKKKVPQNFPEERSGPEEPMACAS